MEEQGNIIHHKPRPTVKLSGARERPFLDVKPLIKKDENHAYPPILIIDHTVKPIPASRALVRKDQ